MNNLDKYQDIDIRDAFFDQVYKMAHADRRIIVLTNDQGAFGLQKLKEDFPDRHINIGIAEQNIINLAAGLAAGGMRPFVYGITNFMSLRCCEQIAVSLCYPKLPVTIIASGGGLMYASDGPTHHAVLDIGVLRPLPNLAIFNPSDAVLTAATAQYCAKAECPCYVRIEKGVLPVLHSPDENLDEGFTVLKPGRDLLIASTGFLMHEAVKVVGLLNEHGIEAGLLDVFRLKPVRPQALIRVLSRYRRVVIMEEQAPIGGLGSLMAEVIADAGLRVEFKRFSLPDQPCYQYGSREWLHKHFGLDSIHLTSIVEGRNMGHTQCP